MGRAELDHRLDCMDIKRANSGGVRRHRGGGQVRRMEARSRIVPKLDEDKPREQT